MKCVRQTALGALAAIVILLPPPAVAEEGGSGHYTPGATASFVDALPARNGLAVANFFSYYTTRTTSSRQLPFGGLVTAGIDATAYADTVIAFYRTPLELLGGYYAAGLALPYVWLTITGEVQGSGPLGGTIATGARDTADGIGDLVVYPFMLAWNGLGGDLRYDVRLGVYLPTGSYEEGNLANVGKNYWTLEPVASLSYLSSKIGLELSAFAGLDFNTKNDATEYRSGDQFHLDVTAAEHLPLLGGVIGVGANGFYYQQLTGDSGSGAVLGDFRGRTVGVGPVLSYVARPWKKDLAAEVKWLPELEVEHRLKGDYVWAKLALQF